MRRVWAIAWLAFREGIRMRVVLVFLVVLVLLVLILSNTLRGDETLAGRLQNYLSYGLGALSILLSITTIFFSCSTLSGELDRRSLHLVVTKPVSRFQVLLGKWLGVNLLNVLILVLCGGAIYGLAHFIRSQPEQFARDRRMIEDVVWTARDQAGPIMPEKEIATAAAEYVDELVGTGAVAPEQRKAEIQKRVRELAQRWRVIESGDFRIYEFADLTPPDGSEETVQVRYKVLAVPAPPEEMVELEWGFLDPETGIPLGPSRFTRTRTGERHQFLVKQAAIRNGKAALFVGNPFDPERRVRVVFDGDESLQILYRVGSFEGNFARALGIIFLRLVLLSALGVFFSVFVSFPVACLCVAAFFLICLGMPFWLESLGVDLEAGVGVDPYGALGPAMRTVFVPLLRLAFPDFSFYDGGQRLIDGVYVSYSLVGRCALHTLMYGGVLLLLPGWVIFQAREVAAVQV